MSFTSKVKTELANRISNAKHCRVAEIAALISMCGNVQIDEFDNYRVFVQTDTKMTATKFRELLWKTFHIDTDVEEKENKLARANKSFVVEIKSSEDSLMVLKETKIMNDQDVVEEQMDISKNSILKRDCCRRAYLRGAFMSSGTVNNPEKSYHFEIKCINENKAKQIEDLFESFDIKPKIIRRKEKYIVYLKESEKVSAALNVIDAPISMMEVENVIINKYMVNKVNRQMNCDSANIKKTVNAARKQIEDIEYIDSEIGIENISDKLQVVARARLANPEVGIQELGELMDPPLGKSGVNHRLRKISEIAEELKTEKKA